MGPVRASPHAEKAILPILLAAAGVRSFITGLTGVLVGLYLAKRGLDPAALGLVVAAGLSGLAVGTGVAGFYAERLGRRRTLTLTSLLGAAGLATFAYAPTVGLLTVAAFIGMVNGMGRDRSPGQTVEHSLMADALDGDQRTGAFVRYAFVQDVAGALGTLALAAPELVAGAYGVAVLPAYRWTFLLLAALTAVPALLYLRLPPDPPPHGPVRRATLSPRSRKRVAGLSALFALDSLGGGFLAGSIVSYWFFQRHGLEGTVLGPVFFVARALNALSYFGAELLARRIGLVRTMVFSHLPSSLLLFALPFAPTATVAIVIFLVREALVQMDVPTRQSYIAAVTGPGERTLAMGITGLVRNIGWAVGPAGAGAAIRVAGIGAPLLIGAILKTVYDLALYASFKNVKPG